MTNPVTVDEIMRLVEKFGEDCYYRVSLISGARDKVYAALTQLVQERDALLARNERLEKAVECSWWRYNNSAMEFRCIHCERTQDGFVLRREAFEHAPDCIVIEKGGGQ